jgi:hypothetical protein
MLGLKSRLSLQEAHRRAPSFIPGGHGLGTPMLAEQRRREKRERIYRWCWRIGMWAVLLSMAFILGYNTRINATEAQRRAGLVYESDWTRIAMAVPTGKRRCAMEWRENCLVCEFRMLSGTQKSTMC